ncbi:MAG: poly-gamma-glutamate hydrolase family protein [Dissulfurispiraceae bacterium]
MGVYENFVELNEAESESVDFCVSVVRKEGSATVIVAPHGGGIEPGTSEVAKEVAKKDMSVAIFEGKKTVGNARLHITSTKFDEPRCVELILSADNVVAIHGEGSAEVIVFLGGRDEKLCCYLQAALERWGYDVRNHTSPDLQGIAVANICNRGRRGVGVQLELSAGLRETFFESLSLRGRKRPTNDLARFAVAIREGLQAAGAL